MTSSSSSSSSSSMSSSMSQAPHRAPVARSVVAVVVAVFGVASFGGCTAVDVGVRRDHPLLAREVGDGPASSPEFRSPLGLGDDRVPDDDADAKDARRRLAAAANAVVGSDAIVVGGVRYRFDCSGVASGIYAKGGVPVDARGDGGGLDVRGLYDLVRRTGSLRTTNPLPGDFVFFDDTYDANGNGRIDDPLSHVGVVEHVDDDGTVVFVHRIGRQIVKQRMNLRQPTVRHDKSGKALNHYLRAASGAVPAKTTAELFVAFGSLPVGPERVALR